MDDTLIKAKEMCKFRLSYFKKICVSISGGADSDIILDMCEENKNDSNEIHYVFFDTGIEYNATKEHLTYLEERYNIKIETIRPKKPIPISVKEFGEPFISKHVSDMIYRLQKHNFKWEDEGFDTLYEKYPKCKCALQWWCNEHPTGSMFNIERNPYLKEFIIAFNPWFKISDKCCTHNKKTPIKNYIKENSIDLDVTGVRRAEGGKRSINIKSCFGQSTSGKFSFRPVFWFKNDDKKEYNEQKNIVNSDCYTIYGLKRTGCAGCPFGQQLDFELQILEKYEPKLYKAVLNIFKNSYVYTKMYREYVIKNK